MVDVEIASVRTTVAAGKIGATANGKENTEVREEIRAEMGACAEATQVGDRGDATDRGATCVARPISERRLTGVDRVAARSHSAENRCLPSRSSHPVSGGEGTMGEM